MATDLNVDGHVWSATGGFKVLSTRMLTLEVSVELLPVVKCKTTVSKSLITLPFI